jgi:cell division protein FtsW
VKRLRRARLGGAARKAPSRQSAPPIEYSLLLTATLCLLAFGAVMVFSASSAKSLLADGGDGAFYLKRTLIFAAIGLLAMRLMAAKGAPMARALTPILLGLSVFGLLAVLVPGVGHTVNGSQRWIGAGFLQFQPTEFAKVALILYGAHLLASEPRRVRSLRGLGPYLLMVGFCALLIAKEPDLGSTMVLCFGVLALLTAAGLKMRTMAPVAATVAIAGLLMITVNPYQQERLTGFLNPSHDATGAGFQAQQAKIAIGSGGVFGVGLGQSVQKASYLPEAHTDMIAAVVGEELGLLGIITLVGLFGLFGWAGMKTAHRARDRYSKLVAAGITSLILAQAALNLFAVLGLAPLTGVTLPFISYGGSSLIVTLAAAGLLLNIARTRGVAASSSTRSSTPQRRRASATTARDARLRVVEGGSSRGRQQRKRSAGNAEHRDRGGRNGRPRRAGDRRRRRTAV